jgi:hypothetical protein
VEVWWWCSEGCVCVCVCNMTAYFSFMHADIQGCERVYSVSLPFPPSHISVSPPPPPFPPLPLSLPLSPPYLNRYRDLLEAQLQVSPPPTTDGHTLYDYLQQPVSTCSVLARLACTMGCTHLHSIHRNTET